MKAFIVNLSGGSMQIDEDEVPAVMKALQSGSIVIVRQGVFNPSYFVSLEEDKRRMLDADFKMKEIDLHNKEVEKSGIGEIKRRYVLDKLNDIFEKDSSESLVLKAYEGYKKLTKKI